MPERPEFIESIRNKLRSDALPGRDAQLQMAALNRPVPRVHPESARTAAVLILLYEKFEEWHTVLIKRKVKAGDRHSGQISLPGGKQEAGESIKETALRETHEEIGIPSSKPRILGQLTQLYIPVSNFTVYPFVGYLELVHNLIPEESEVERIFEVPVPDFLNPENIGRTTIDLPEGLSLKNVPHFRVHDQIVWGATAMIMSEFVAMINPESRLNSLHSAETGQGR